MFQMFSSLARRFFGDSSSSKSRRRSAGRGRGGRGRGGKGRGGKARGGKQIARGVRNLFR